MAEFSSENARNQFSELMNRAAYGKERLVLTRRGKKLVAMVPIEDLELLQKIEDVADIKDALEALKEPGSLSLKDLKAILGD